MKTVWYLVHIMKIGKEIPIETETDRYLLDRQYETTIAIMV